LHEAVDRGAALYAEDPLEMASLITSFWKDAAERLMQAEKARRFVESYVASRGDASARLVARAVLESSPRLGSRECGALERE
jgi:L-amino acid N-acyltransferase YncA